MKKLELNFNRKHVIIFGLLTIILLATIFLIRNTYGYYQENLELKDSLEMTVATLSYGLNEEYKVVVPAQGEVRVPIAVMGLNSQETKYQMYYRSSNDLENVIIGYASYSSNLPSGDLMIGESKQVSLILKNNGDSEATLFIGVKGGYQNNSVEDILLGNGEIRITNRIESEEVSEDMATPEDILAGKKAWVNGNQITGTMVNRGTVNQTLKAGESYTIPEGYHNGSGKVTAASLASQTPGTATADDITSGKTAWVNGIKITGTGQSTSNIVDNLYSGNTSDSTIACSTPISININQNDSYTPFGQVDTLTYDGKSDNIYLLKKPDGSLGIANTISITYNYRSEEAYGQVVNTQQVIYLKDEAGNTLDTITNSTGNRTWNLFTMDIEGDYVYFEYHLYGYCRYNTGNQYGQCHSITGFTNPVVTYLTS